MNTQLSPEEIKKQFEKRLLSYNKSKTRGPGQIQLPDKYVDKSYFSKHRKKEK